MRWKVDKINKKDTGEFRIIRKFLWLPTEISDEIRWLERATIKQQKFTTFDLLNNREYTIWKNYRWLT